MKTEKTATEKTATEPRTMTMEELCQLEERIEAIEAQGGAVMTGYNGHGTGHIFVLGNQTGECDNPYRDSNAAKFKAFEFATEADAVRYVHEWCAVRPQSTLMEAKPAGHRDSTWGYNDGSESDQN